MGKAVTRILQAAIQSVDPGNAVTAYINKIQDKIYIDGQVVPEDHGQIVIIGAGKASEPMLVACGDILKDDIHKAFVITKEGYRSSAQLPDQMRCVEAGHPIPDERGVKNTHVIMEMLSNLSSKDIVICLFSGGGSALLVSPVPGVTLDDLQQLTTLLLRCGATINEINCLRKHLDEVKGGQLARLASPARIYSLILSDVVGDPLDVIASGPTVPDPTTYQDALAVIEKYKMSDQVAPAIRDHLNKGINHAIADTPKMGEPIFAQVKNLIIGSNRTAALAACTQAELEGFNTLLLTNYLQGEAAETGKVLSSFLKQIDSFGEPLPRPACLIAGGETTVTMESSGLGGRNQELALQACLDLKNYPNLALISLASDGGDGPTDAAGAIAWGDTFENAIQMGLKPEQYLANHDSYHFFEPLGELIKTGPTLTNVNDLIFLFAF